jgi:hypothetical protein
MPDRSGSRAPRDLLIFAGIDLEQDFEARLAYGVGPPMSATTLVNRLLGEERLLTGPEAGITGDAIAMDWAWRGRYLVNALRQDFDLTQGLRFE